MRIHIPTKRRLPAVLIAGLMCFEWGCGSTPHSDQIKTFTVAASNASNPTIALDKKAETIYVAWIGTAEQTHQVYLARKSKNEEQFSAPVQVNDIAGDASAHSEAPAQVAAGPEGNVYVLWHNEIPIEGRRFPASDLRFARSIDGGKTFSPAIFVNDDHGQLPQTSHGFHSLAVGPDSAIYACWLDSRNKEIAPAVMVARSIDGGRSFEPGVVVAQKICPCCRTAVTVDASGILYVAYRNAPPDNVRNMAIARSEDRGKTFSTPGQIHNDGWVIDGCPHNGPALDTDAAGNVHVAWYTGKEEGYGVYYAISKNRGEQFTAPIHLNAGMEASPMRATIAAWSESAVLLACEATDGTGSQIYLLGPEVANASQMKKQSIASGVYPAVARQSNLIAVAWLDGDAIQAAVKRFDQITLSSF